MACACHRQAGRPDGLFHALMSTTKAYQEISDGHSPLVDNLRSVQTLLHYLLQQHAITKELYDRLFSFS